MNIVQSEKNLTIIVLSLFAVQQIRPMQSFLYDHVYVSTAAVTALAVLAVPASRQWVKDLVVFGIPAFHQWAKDKAPTVITRLGFICNSDRLINHGMALYKSQLRQNIYQFTPLHIAADDGDVAALEELVQSGADLDAIAYGAHAGDTPLHCAALCGPVASVKILVKAGANIDAINHRSLWTPAHSAAFGDNIDVVKILVQAGADLTARTSGGSSIADLAPKGSQIHEYLLHVDRYTKNFMLALDRHDIRMARQAIDDGAIIVQPDQDGVTPLHRLVSVYDQQKPTDYDEIAKLIIQTIGRQSRKLRTHTGITPLHLAAGYGNRRLMRLLIGNGADVNAQDNEGNTPLHYAFNQRTVDLLLQNHADIAIENHQGEVPISAIFALVSQSRHLLALLENK